MLSLLAGTVLLGISIHLPLDVREYIDIYPKQSLIYHHFAGDCRGMVMPKYSIMVTAGGKKSLIGNPPEIRRNAEFVLGIFKQNPIQIYDYNSCNEGGKAPIMNQPKQKPKDIMI